MIGNLYNLVLIIDEPRVLFKSIQCDYYKYPKSGIECLNIPSKYVYYINK